MKKRELIEFLLAVLLGTIVYGAFIYLMYSVLKNYVN